MLREVEARDAFARSRSIRPSPRRSATRFSTRIPMRISTTRRSKSGVRARSAAPHDARRSRRRRRPRSRGDRRSRSGIVAGRARRRRTARRAGDAVVLPPVAQWCALVRRARRAEPREPCHVDGLLDVRGAPRSRACAPIRARPSSRKHRDAAVTESRARLARMQRPGDASRRSRERLQLRRRRDRGGAPAPRDRKVKSCAARFTQGDGERVVQPPRARAHPSPDDRNAAARDRAGHGGGVRALPASLAARRAGLAPARNRWHAANRAPARGLRNSGCRVGGADSSGARRRLQARIPRSSCATRAT